MECGERAELGYSVLLTVLRGSKRIRRGCTRNQDLNVKILNVLNVSK
jgi:hypothetical protein